MDDKQREERRERNRAEFKDCELDNIRGKLFESITGPDWRQQREYRIELRNKAITSLLAENERERRKEAEESGEPNGKEGWRERILLEENEEARRKRVHIPEEYIETLDSFREDFHIREIFPQRQNCYGTDPDKQQKVRSKTVEHLQMMDWFQYMMTRFYIFGGIERLTYKYAFINAMSIMESMIQQVSKCNYYYCRYRYNGTECEHLEACGNYFSEAKDKRVPVKKLLAFIESRDLLQFENAEDYKILNELFDLRNNIHIQKENRGQSVEEAEQNDAETDKRNYMLAMEYLKKTADACAEHMVPFYEKCRGYDPGT